MKKFLLLSTLSLLLRISVAQYILSFCESVSLNGVPFKPSNSFMINTNGSTLTLFFKADEKINTSQVEFRIYYMNSKGNEEELTRIIQNIEPGWNYAWKEAVFFNEGNYRIKVYNANGAYLTSANLNAKDGN